MKKYPHIQSILTKLNSIVEQSYEQIGKVINEQPSSEFPESIKTKLLEIIDQEHRKASISSLTYEFEKVRRDEIEKFRKAESDTGKTTSETKTALPDSMLPSFINEIDEIMDATDEIIDHSYENIKELVNNQANGKISSSNKVSILKQIDAVTNSSLDFEYETLKKAIESQPGISWSAKQNFLGEIDEIINGYLSDEYEKFKKNIEQQSQLNLSVKQSLLLLAAAITLRKDSGLAKLVDQLLGMGSLPDSVEQNLLLLAQQAQIKVDGVKDELNQFRKEIENWFDKSMERAEGVYKRNSKLMAILVGSLVAVAVNADTVHIISKLSEDQLLRSTLITAADDIATKDPRAALCLSKTAAARSADPQCSEALKSLDQATKNVSLPVGWGPSNRQKQFEAAQSLKFLGFFRVLLGWFVSGIALSMGANFWYELLGKFINVRNTGKIPSSSRNQANAPSSVTGDQ